MQQMTKQAIKKLQSETNHAINAEDFDLIEELDAIADDFAGVSQSERRLLNQPFVLCGINFYPLTVAKSLWYIEKCEEWEVTGTYQDGFLFWLLSLPNDEESLDKYSEKKCADKAIKRLSRRLHCSQDEMTEVYHKCLGMSGSKSEESDSKDADYGGMIAVLLREYGGTTEKWLYETPVEMISTLFDAYAKKVEAENGTVKKSAAQKGKAIAPQPSKKLSALSKFRAKVNEIKELWSVNDGE